jgi:hypothetical protein
MTEKPCRRLEELEKISAAAASRRLEKNSDSERKDRRNDGAGARLAR